MKRNIFALCSVYVLLLLSPVSQAASDPLPSWKTGDTKKAIIKFVDKVTDPKDASYVAPAERIAVFDNDGTLWAEQPLYFQAFFAMDQIKALADDHPEWKTQEPFASVIKGDTKAALAGAEEALMKLVMASHTGITTEQFSSRAEAWLKTAKHPTENRLYTEMIYQPMLELLTYLRANDFKTFIVSGGGIDFLRVFSEAVYGIPPEQVVGSSIKSEFKIVDGVPTIIRNPELNFIDDKAGKPIGIYQHIGRKPIAAFGNSDGDLQMLQWTCMNNPASLCAIVHHTDAKREWAYDKDSVVGKLDKATAVVKEQGWLMVDMKNDWKTIFPK